MLFCPFRSSRTRFHSLFAVLVLLSSSLGHAAEVFYWEPMDPEKPGFYDWSNGGPDGVWLPGSINITGTIEAGDLGKIIAVLKAQEYMPGFAISSEGGDVVEAMKIGRFFRDSMLNITVNDNADCFSACFLIVAGATGRNVRAPIGIHRAYFDSEYFKSLPPIEAERQFRRLDISVRQYLYEMYIAEDVIAEMVSTKSTKGSYLSPDEFRRRVGQYSPAIEEWKIANCGEMTDGEAVLYTAVLAITQFEENYAEKEAHLLNEEDREWLNHNARYIDLGASLSVADRDRLWDKHQRVYGCLGRLEREHKKNILNAIKNK